MLAQFEDGAAEAKLANEDQELMKSIMRSMILSGGIPTREFPSLFSPSFQHQFAALKERLGGVEEQEHADADAARHDELINAILSGKSEAVESMIKQLIASSTKLRPTERISDERSKRLVRAMFALMVKMTGASNHCLTIMEQSNEGSYEKVLKLWGQALKIKRGFTDKKSDLPSSLSEAEWEAALDKLESNMMEKIQLLLKFKPIAVIEQEKLQSKRKLLCSDRMRRAFAASKASPAEQLKQKLQSWKNLQTVQKKEESYEGNVESSIMLIIESDITRAQLLSAIETHYIRGILIFHSLILFERGLRNLHSKAIRHDLLSWFLATFRMSETSNVKHYSELTTSCGVEFQQVLRTAFFGVIKQVLKYITASSEVMEVSYLLTALNWHYSASDHLHILDSGILQSLKKSDTFVSTLWGRLVGKYKISSYALLRTFEFIVTKVVSRLAKQQEEPGSGREDAQRLTKSVSLIDERNAMTLVHEIWRMIFDEIRSAAESFESTPGIDPVVLQEFSQMMKKQSEKEIKPREMSAIRASSMKCAKRFSGSSERGLLHTVLQQHPSTSLPLPACGPGQQAIANEGDPWHEGGGAGIVIPNPGVRLPTPLLPSFEHNPSDGEAVAEEPGGRGGDLHEAEGGVCPGLYSASTARLPPSLRLPQEGGDVVHPSVCLKRRLCRVQVCYQSNSAACRELQGVRREACADRSDGVVRN